MYSTTVEYYALNMSFRPSLWIMLFRFSLSSLIIYTTLKHFLRNVIHFSLWLGICKYHLITLPISAFKAILDECKFKF